MTLVETDQDKLLPLLRQLSEAIEELLLTGLTTASQNTRAKIDVAFREASRLRLLRLGSTLRVVGEELSRFVRKDESFSRSRFTFFLNRAWLLSRGLARAIENRDQQQFLNLLWTPSNEPVETLRVVTLGVVKRVVPGAFCAFDFRLRTLEETANMPAGAPASWSCVFPMKPGAAIPPEGFLHLPQKQKFKAAVFLEGREILFQKAMVATSPFATSRVSFLPDSQVTVGDEFSQWSRFATWDLSSSLDRLRAYQASPLDLEVDLQEEVVLNDWQLETTEPQEREHQLIYEVNYRGLAMELVVSANDESKSVRDFLKKSVKPKKRPALFGLMHYSMCRPVMEPLTALEEGGPKHLHISNEKIDQKALLQAIQFT
jgi:hypothetical protein